MKATRQLISLCLVIGMTIVGNFSVLAQGNEYAHAASYVKRSIPTSTNEIRELTVGDKVPDIEISSIINYPASKAKISDFKGKLIIFDFWGTTCSSCIRALPKLDSLQKLFKDQIQVLTVTNYDTKEKVQKTLQRYRKTKDLHLPIVLYGDVLKGYFPHEYVSHVVWIDGSGVVKAITGTDYVTADNIQAILVGKEIKWPVKKDVPDFDYNKPFLDFSQGNVERPEFFYYSSFSGYIDGIDGTDRVIIDSSKKTITINHFNSTLFQLCDGALNGSGTGMIPLDKLILHAKDSSRFIKGNDYWGAWKKKNTYCYSITVPLDMSENKRREMITKDLTHWLSVIGVNVKKEEDKYIITEKGTNDN